MSDTSILTNVRLARWRNCNSTLAWNVWVMSAGVLLALSSSTAVILRFKQIGLGWKRGFSKPTERECCLNWVVYPNEPYTSVAGLEIHVSIIHIFLPWRYHDNSYLDEKNTSVSYNISWKHYLGILFRRCCHLRSASFGWKQYLKCDLCKSWAMLHWFTSNLVGKPFTHDLLHDALMTFSVHEL